MAALERKLIYELILRKLFDQKEEALNPTYSINCTDLNFLNMFLFNLMTSKSQS